MKKLKVVLAVLVMLLVASVSVVVLSACDVSCSVGGPVTCSNCCNCRCTNCPGASCDCG